jgi:hypothetical protein
MSSCSCLQYHMSLSSGCACEDSGRKIDLTRSATGQSLRFEGDRTGSRFKFHGPNDNKFTISILYTGT